MADWALQQLVNMAGQMTPEQAKEHEDKARDEMERKAKEELKEAKRKIKSLNSNDFSKKCSKELPISLEVSPLPQRYLTIVAEDMKHICRFQVTLRKIPGNENLNLMGVQMSISEVSGSASLLELRVEGNVVVFSTIFPRSIADESLQLVNDATLLLTLPYQDDPAAGELGARKILASIDEINLIQCGSCHQPLLPGKPIERTAELPVGHWDEITDYLICYSGVSKRFVPFKFLIQNIRCILIVLFSVAATSGGLFPLLGVGGSKSGFAGLKYSVLESQRLVRNCKRFGSARVWRRRTRKERR